MTNIGNPFNALRRNNQAEKAPEAQTNTENKGGFLSRIGVGKAPAQGRASETADSMNQPQSGIGSKLKKLVPYAAIAGLAIGLDRGFSSGAIQNWFSGPFSNFFTESIPHFFTESIPHFFRETIKLGMDVTIGAATMPLAAAVAINGALVGAATVCLKVFNNQDNKLAKIAALKEALGNDLKEGQTLTADQIKQTGVSLQDLKQQKLVGADNKLVDLNKAQKRAQTIRLASGIGFVASVSGLGAFNGAWAGGGLGAGLGAAFGGLAATLYLTQQRGNPIADAKYNAQKATNDIINAKRDDEIAALKSELEALKNANGANSAQDDEALLKELERGETPPNTGNKAKNEDIPVPQQDRNLGGEEATEDIEFEAKKEEEILKETPPEEGPAAVKAQADKYADLTDSISEKLDLADLATINELDDEGQNAFWDAILNQNEAGEYTDLKDKFKDLLSGKAGPRNEAKDKIHNLLEEIKINPSGVKKPSEQDKKADPAPTRGIKRKGVEVDEDANNKGADKKDKAADAEAKVDADKVDDQKADGEEAPQPAPNIKDAEKKDKAADAKAKVGAAKVDGQKADDNKPTPPAPDNIGADKKDGAADAANDDEHQAEGDKATPPVANGAKKVKSPELGADVEKFQAEMREKLAAFRKENELNKA